MSTEWLFWGQKQLWTFIFFSYTRKCYSYISNVLPWQYFPPPLLQWGCGWKAITRLLTNTFCGQRPAQPWLDASRSNNQLILAPPPKYFQPFKVQGNTCCVVRCIEMKCSAVQWILVKCSAVQCSGVLPMLCTMQGDLPLVPDPKGPNTPNYTARRCNDAHVTVTLIHCTSVYFTQGSYNTLAIPDSHTWLKTIKNIVIF